MLVEAGVIRTARGLHLSRRLSDLQRDFETLLGQHPVASAGVEKLFFTKNVTTGMAVAHARGVVYAALGGRGIAVREYTPSQVKKAVCGSGRADKRAMMEMTRRLLGLREVLRPDDTADAAAVALCHVFAHPDLMLPEPGETRGAGPAARTADKTRRKT